MLNEPRNGSFLVVSLIVVVIAAGGYAVTKWWSSTPPTVDNTISEDEVAYATTNLIRLFRDAQYSFIHRHGGAMAKSITELGNGFSIGSYGSLIDEEIWLARLDRPENELVPEKLQGRLEKSILARPYRYAILPVQNFLSAELDQRTSCILAIPTAQEATPLLVLIGGPIRSDPDDFYRDYPIHIVKDVGAIKEFRQAAERGTPVGKVFFNEFLEGWDMTNAPTVSNNK